LTSVRARGRLTEPVTSAGLGCIGGDKAGITHHANPCRYIRLQTVLRSQGQAGPPLQGHAPQVSALMFNPESSSFQTGHTTHHIIWIVIQLYSVPHSKRRIPSNPPPNKQTKPHTTGSEPLPLLMQWCMKSPMRRSTSPLRATSVRRCSTSSQVCA